MAAVGGPRGRGAEIPAGQPCPSAVACGRCLRCRQTLHTPALCQQAKANQPGSREQSQELANTALAPLWDLFHQVLGIDDGFPD